MQRSEKADLKPKSRGRKEQLGDWLKKVKGREEEGIGDEDEAAGLPSKGHAVTTRARL